MKEGHHLEQRIESGTVAPGAPLRMIQVEVEDVRPPEVDLEERARIRRVAWSEEWVRSWSWRPEQIEAVLEALGPRSTEWYGRFQEIIDAAVEKSSPAKLPYETLPPGHRGW